MTAGHVFVVVLTGVVVLIDVAVIVQDLGSRILMLDPVSWILGHES